MEGAGGAGIAANSEGKGDSRDSRRATWPERLLRFCANRPPKTKREKTTKLAAGFLQFRAFCCSCFRSSMWRELREKRNAYRERNGGGRPASHARSSGGWPGRVRDANPVAHAALALVRHVVELMAPAHIKRMLGFRTQALPTHGPAHPSTHPLTHTLTHSR